MFTPLDKSVDPLRALRSHRLRQISSFISIAILLVLPIYAYEQMWTTVIPLVCGLCMMGVCLLSDRKGKSDAASAILVVSLAVIAATLQWVDQGLRDASMLAFPVVLILAGLLIKTRYLIVLLIAMIIFLIVMTLATETFHIRHNLDGYDPFDHLRDAILYLLIIGWFVWFVVNDLRKTILQKNEQFDKYQASQEQITHISQHDMLSGLPNQLLARELIQQAIYHASRTASQVAFMFVGVDNFKYINNSFGYAVGDNFLKLAVERLEQSVREYDIVARHAGDEFIIAITHISEIQEASKAARNILINMMQPYMLNGTQIVTSCSIGIAMFPDDGSDYESLLNLSNIAMNQAKRAGRNTLCFFDPGMQEVINSRVALENELRKAIDNEQFHLHYQVQVDHLSRTIGAEVLIRWMHPEQGMVSPAQFISLAEETGLILTIGNWVLNSACAQISAWQKDNLTLGLTLAVNVSAKQFRQADFVSQVEAAIQHHGIIPRLLKLELTESLLLEDVSGTVATMHALKEIGVQFSLDDFGTGYSSLQYLKQLPLNQIKIDQSFVRDIAIDQNDAAIVQTIIAMAETLGFEVIAEGVETEAQRDFLDLRGCHAYQGYLFGKPMAIEQFEALITQT